MGRLTAWALPRAMPRSDTIIFGSDRIDDPDALVILDYLAEHSSRPLRWTARSLPATQLLSSENKQRIDLGVENCLSSLLAYGRAPIVFHTFGLYASPKPPRSQTVINVWHGDGPKSTPRPRIGGTYTVSGVDFYGRQRIRVHGYPTENLLVTGRPRVDDLFKGAQDLETRNHQSDGSTDLGPLKLDSRPIVWWLPTWRQNKNGRSTFMDARLAPTMQLSTDLLERYQFIVKPHPLTAESAWPSGWRVLTDADLYEKGIRFYRALGRAHAVITDYSSIWTDLLSTKIPIAFVYDDLAEFTAARGFYIDDWQNKLPGPILFDQHEFTEFIKQGWTEEHSKRRQDLSRQLGAVNEFGATARMFSALDEKGVMWR